MTRRNVLFIALDGARYITPGFNGDKEMFETIHNLFGGGDSCEKTWAEMVRDIWANATSYTEFVKANASAQACYHSALGDNPVEPVEELQSDSELPKDADEILILFEQENNAAPLVAVYDHCDDGECFESAKKMPMDVYLGLIGMKEVPRILISDGMTLRWEDDGKNYAVVFKTDSDPENPRHSENYDIELHTTMACWHRRYHLGDADAVEKDETPAEFWRRITVETIGIDNLVEMAKLGDGKIRAVRNDDGFYAVYLEGNDTPIATEVAEDELGDLIEYDEELPFAVYQELMAPYCEWMPLWLYDHSGLTMSCGSREYPYNDQFDSMQVGFIIAFKDTIISKANATEDNWREVAKRSMESDVKVYDMWLRGECYGYVEYELENADDDTDDGDEVGSCWGFIGDELSENGMLDQIGHGFKAAFVAGKTKET